MRKKVDKTIGYLLAFLMTLMLFSVLWQVFTRYFLGAASSFTEELARFLLIWIGILGAAFVAGKKMHLAIDLLPSKLKGRKKRILTITIDILIILFVVATFIIGGGELVYISYLLGQTSAALQIPLTYVYIILPISGFIVCYYKIMDIIDTSSISEFSPPSSTTKIQE